jgi:hypothetical protein
MVIENGKFIYQLTDTLFELTNAPSDLTDAIFGYKKSTRFIGAS